MQVMIYVRSNYDSQLIQKVSEALDDSWPLVTLDLVVLFDTSSVFFTEAPTMVRIISTEQDKKSMSMSSLSSPIQSSHYDALHHFHHLEDSNDSQLIFIDKNSDLINTGSKILKKLLQTDNKILPSRRILPKQLEFLQLDFNVYYQEKNNHCSNPEISDTVSSFKFDTEHQQTLSRIACLL